MKAEKTIISLLSVISLTLTLPFSSYSAETHTLDILDYDGKVLDTIVVNDGDTPDLSIYEKSDRLNYHPNEYTQIGFSSWSRKPENITQDMQIRALSVEMTLEKVGKPEITEYFSKKGKIRTDGFKIRISRSTQIYDPDSENETAVKRDYTDITSTCEVHPSTLEEAFRDGNNALVEIIPANSVKPVFSYTVSCFENLGDADNDGSVNAVDASVILGYYSQYQTGKTPDITEERFRRCDIDRNNTLDSSDASLILTYYAKDQTSADGVLWEDILY